MAWGTGVRVELGVETPRRGVSTIGAGVGTRTSVAASVGAGGAVGIGVGTGVMRGVGLGDALASSASPPAPALPWRPLAINPRATASPPAIRARMTARSQGVALPRSSARTSRLVGALVWVGRGGGVRGSIVTVRRSGLASATGLILVGALLIAPAGRGVADASAVGGDTRPMVVIPVASPSARTKSPALAQRSLVSAAIARSSTGSRAGDSPAATLLGGGG